MNAVMARGETRPTGYQTEFAGDEVNAYLQLRLTAKFPDGGDRAVRVAASIRAA